VLSTGVVDDDMMFERGRLGTGCWQMVTRAAASELASAVGCYSGYREEAGQPVRRREVAVHSPTRTSSVRGGSSSVSMATSPSATFSARQRGAGVAWRTGSGHT
jgi:hypothetical protein